MKAYFPALISFLFFCLLASCTDPIMVGSDLLDDDRATVGETTSIPFTARTVREDSILTFNGATLAPSNTFAFGQLEDELFGTSRNSVYISPTLTRTASGLFRAPLFADIININIDSIVLILPIDTARAFYGPGREFPIRLLEMTESLDRTQDYYSTSEFATGMDNLAQDNSFFASRTARLVHDTAVANSGLRRAHVRIRFNENFVDRIDQLNSDDFETDTIFREQFAGVLLEPAGPSDALVNLAPPILMQGDTAFSGFYFYYRDTTNQPTFYRAPFELWNPLYEKDFSGSLAEELIDEGSDAEYLAVAGQGGLMTEINFGDLSELEGRVINRATLEFPIADVDGLDYEDFPPPSRVELFYRETASGPLVPIYDRVELERARASVLNIDFFIDGLLRTRDGVQLYSPTFSIHMQRIVDGEAPPTLYLRVTPLRTTEFRAARAFLNTPYAPQNPSLLKVNFTSLE